MGPVMALGSTPEQIAEVVYTATTDGTDQLRYEAGWDAIQLLAGRHAAEDKAFFADIRKQFGLDA